MNEPPLDRHLSTVGIGAVFLTQPPDETLASHYYVSSTAAASPSASASNNGDKQATDGGNETVVPTHEFIGSIKSTPSDFIVREIGGLPRSLCCPDEGTAARQTKTGGEGGETTGGEETEGGGGESTDNNNDDDGDESVKITGAAAASASGNKNVPADSKTDADNTLRAQVQQGEQVQKPEQEAEQAVTPAPSTAARLYPAVRVADITDTETLPVRPNVASRMASANANNNNYGGGGAGYNGTVSLPRVNIGITNNNNNNNTGNGGNGGGHHDNNGERANKKPRLER